MKPRYLIILICILSNTLNVFRCFCFQAACLAAGDETRRILDDFYSQVELTSAKDTSEIQISKLQEFLLKHPNFEPVYFKLLEKYLDANKIQEAIDYFQSLKDNLSYRSNSYWVLARIHVLQNDAISAFNCYKHALNTTTVSSSLIKDIVVFNYQNTELFNENNILHQVDLSSEKRIIVSALLKWQMDDYLGAIHQFFNASEKSLRNTLILDILGECCYNALFRDKADSLWRIGLSLSRQNRDRQSETKFLINLARVRRSHGEYNNALSYCDSACIIAKRIYGLNLMQLIEGELGNISYLRGDYDSSLTHYKKAILLASKLYEERSLLEWNKYYSQVLFEQGEMVTAFHAIDESEKIAEKIKSKYNLIDILIRKGNYYAYLNQPDFAKRLFNQAYQLASKFGFVEMQHQAKGRLAVVLLLENEYALAREAFNEYINYLDQTGDKVQKGYFYSRIASSYLAEGHYELAKKYYTKAFEFEKNAQSNLYMVWYLIKIADIEVIEGNTTNAIQRYNSAKKIAIEENNMHMLWQIYLGLGKASQKEGNLTTAISFYTHAARVIEESRKTLGIEDLRIGYFSDRNQVYQKLINCYFERYKKNNEFSDLDSLYYFLGLTRGRSLQDQFYKKDFSKSNEYEQACDYLHQLQNRLRHGMTKFQTGDECDSLLSQLEIARYSLIAQRLKSVDDGHSVIQKQLPSVHSLKNIQKSLKNTDQAILLYHISEDASFVLTIDESAVKVVPLSIVPSNLTKILDSLMTPLHNVKQVSMMNTVFKAGIAHRLYELLFKPIEEMIILPERLLIVPDLVLMNLPFEMLIDQKPDFSEYTPTDFPDYKNKFLINRYSFAYVPSTSCLGVKSKPMPNKAKVLVFANPFGKISMSASYRDQLRSLTGWCFNPLPHADYEAACINDVLLNIKIYRRANATKDVFFKEAPKHHLIHFATHGFADLTFDAFSGLVLAASDDSSDDGMLMGYEISNLKLNCNLVTLSACETGHGKLVAGEGILGLPRLFLLAGAKSVLMTLWKVDDRFTSQLMPTFYDFLVNHRLAKADALSKAKRTILGEGSSNSQGLYYHHPFYWAPFCLYGEPWISKETEDNTLRNWIIIITILFSAIILILFFRYKHRHYHQHVKFLS